MCLWRETWYTVCGHYLGWCERCRKAKIVATPIGRRMTNVAGVMRERSMSIFKINNNTSDASKPVPPAMLGNPADYVTEGPTCAPRDPARSELFYDLCPECQELYEQNGFPHLWAQHIVRNWRLAEDYNISDGAVKLENPLEGLIQISRYPVEELDKQMRHYTHRRPKNESQELKDNLAVTKEIVEARDRRLDEEERLEAEAALKMQARMISAAATKSAKLTKKIAQGQQPRDRDHTDRFNADPERDAANALPRPPVPRANACPETFVDIDLEEDGGIDKDQQERAAQKKAVETLRKMTADADHELTIKDKQDYKKAQAAAHEAKRKAMQKTEDAIRKHNEKKVQKEAELFANADPRGGGGTDFNIPRNTGLNAIGRRPSGPAPQQPQPEWPARRPVSIRTGTSGFENRRPSGPPPPVRPGGHSQRKNTVFPSAAQFTTSRASTKPRVKSRQAGADAYGDAYDPDFESSGEWADNDPEGIQLRELGKKLPRRERDGAQARNLSFSRDEEDIIRQAPQPPPLARPPPATLAGPARTATRPPPVPVVPQMYRGLMTQKDLETAGELLAKARQSNDAIPASERQIYVHPSNQASFASAKPRGTTNDNSFGSRCPLVASPKPLRMDEEVFIIGEDSPAGTPVRPTFANETSASGVSRSPIPHITTPPSARARAAANNRGSPGLDVYGICDSPTTFAVGPPTQVYGQNNRGSGSESRYASGNGGPRSLTPPTPPLKDLKGEYVMSPEAQKRGQGKMRFKEL